MNPALAAALRHFEAAAPEEGVGAIVRSEGWAFRPFRNVAASRTRAFELDPLEWMRFEAAVLGQSVWLLHSHPEAPATLSARDLETFTIDGRPLLPNLELGVVSLVMGRAVDTRWWGFSEGQWRPSPGL